MDRISFYAYPPERINAYYLGFNSAEIRRLHERIDTLRKRDAMETVEETIGAVRMLRNVEDNRLQLFFPGKPDEATRNKLKSAGFRWSPFNKAWQRHLSPHAEYVAKDLLAHL